MRGFTSIQQSDVMSPEINMKVEGCGERVGAQKYLEFLSFE